MAWSSSKHLLRVSPNRNHATSFLIHCDNRWLIYNDAVVSQVDQCIRSTKVYTDVCPRKSKKAIEYHTCSLLNMTYHRKGCVQEYVLQNTEFFAFVPLNDKLQT